MLLPSPQTIKKQYIKPEGHENLRVIPYLRGRLTFAELVARALEEDGFEQVFVDLPFFLNKGGLWQKAVERFPCVSSLLVRKQDSTFASFPFVPNDAPCMAMAVVHMLGQWGRTVELSCFDDSQVIHYPKESLAQPEIRLRDDYLVFVVGLEQYFNTVYPQLEAAWARMTADQKFFIQYRAGLVADRLKASLKNNKKTLFVCEYRLWWFMEKILQSSSRPSEPYFSHRWKDADAALVAEEPLSLWARGGLDDAPRVTFRFYESTKTNTLQSFDKLRELEGIVGSLHHSRELKRLHSSVRKKMAFYQYLQNRLTIEARMMPGVVTHLAHSARSCVGKKFARELVSRCLDYPHEHAKRVQGYYNIGQGATSDRAEAFPIPSGRARDFIYTGTHQYSQDSVGNTLEDRLAREGLILFAYRKLSAQEQADLKRGNGFTWEVQRDFTLIERACTKVREMSRMEIPQKRIARSWGSLGDGIAWKATIASKATGEDALYVRTRRVRKWEEDSINDFTPITFLFTEDFRGHDTTTLLDGDVRYLDYAAKSGSSLFGAGGKNKDYVQSVFITFHAYHDIYNDLLYNYDLSSLTLLYTRGVIGSGRYDKIVKRENRFHCRMGPTEDRDTKNYDLSEMGVAWAVKYAEGVVLVVTGHPWKPSQRLADYARKRKVRIIRQPLSVFNPEFIERMKKFHMMSTSLQFHPQRDAIVERFVD